jgi:hypothetical protein
MYAYVHVCAYIYLCVSQRQWPCIQLMALGSRAGMCVHVSMCVFICKFATQA